MLTYLSIPSSIQVQYFNQKGKSNYLHFYIVNFIHALVLKYQRPTMKLDYDKLESLLLKHNLINYLDNGVKEGGRVRPFTVNKKKVNKLIKRNLTRLLISESRNNV